MKISDKEVQAALSKYYSFKGSTSHDNMRAALSAVYTVRAARKAAKRAKAKPDHEAAASAPEQPEHRFKVGDRVVHTHFGVGNVVSNDGSYLSYRVMFDGGNRHWCRAEKLTPEPAAPAWNGKFEVGKSYRTDDGHRAWVRSEMKKGEEYRLIGEIDELPGQYTWTDSGRICRYMVCYLDLIGPWED